VSALRAIPTLIWMAGCAVFGSRGRRADDAITWPRTVLVCVALLLALFLAGLALTWVEAQFGAWRETTTALELARCERDAIAMGEPTGKCRGAK
jgi:hypothetical protein